MKKTVFARYFNLAAAFAGTLIAVLASCTPLVRVPDKEELVSRSVTINVQAGEKIYLVKYNPGSTTVAAKHTGSARSVNPAALMSIPPQSGRRAEERQPASPGSVSPTHHRGAMEFNANPPEFKAAPRRATRTPSMSPTLGDNEQFWVQDGPYNTSNWIQIPATLKADGTHCRVWVADTNFTPGSTGSNKVNQAAVDNLAAAFDLVYPKETALIGYEKGGGAGGDGGADGDLKIQILIYDIDYDYTSSQTGGTLGFFWGKDEYTQAMLNASGYGSLKTNNAEIFYLDAHFLGTKPATMYATLIHEFQHMILFNQKSLSLGLSLETWYDEMMAMIAEDLLAPDVGVPVTDPGHPVKARIRYFNPYYLYGFTEWRNGMTIPPDYYDVLVSYGNAYAFGAYIARNYGGAKLLYEMAHNNSANLASVDAALRTVTGNAVGFDTALEKFPEALLNTSVSNSTYDASGVLTGGFATYNHPTVGADGGPQYAGYDFDAFNISTIENRINGFGPSIGSVQRDLGPRGIDVQLFGTVSNSGTIDITIESYTNSPVKMYLVGKSGGTLTRK